MKKFWQSRDHSNKLPLQSLQAPSQKGAIKSLMLIITAWFAVFAVGINLYSLPAHAETGADQAEHGSERSASQSNPDNLLEYTEQQIDELQHQDLNLPDSVTEVFNKEDNAVLDQAGKLQGSLKLTGEYNESYYLLEELNAGLPKPIRSPNLSTPLATLEFFQSAIIKEQYNVAAQALNLNLFDKKEQAERSAELAKHLDFLLSNQGLYVFEDVPDRPDGLVEPPVGSTSSVAGIPRRSIKLGYINYRDRQVPIFIERVRVKDEAPVWVFSGQTVGNIDGLYEQYKPPEFAKYLPEWLTLRFFGMAIWEFFLLLLFICLMMGGGWLASKGVHHLLTRFIHNNNKVSDQDSLTTGTKSLSDFFDKLVVPLTLTIGFGLVFTLVSGGLPVVEPIATSTRPIIWIFLVISALWLSIRIVNFFSNRYYDLQINNVNDDESDKYRRRSTYVSILRRIFIFIVILGSIWIGLSEFTNIEGLGTTLLTSAGIAGAVIGFAAQPILGNIIAGMQIALTQPIRIGDTVMMDDDWCTVEDLRYTYAILKTWDERNLFVPMRYFVTDIVENWSHPRAHQTRPLHLYVDYRANIDEIRQKFIELVKAHKLWDGETEPFMMALSVSENTVHLRGALASDSPINAWTLECDVREQMMAYLNEEQKTSLPVERITFKDE